MLLLLERIGAAWDILWWHYFLGKNKPPPPGHDNHIINTGVFIIRPGEQYKTTGLWADFKFSFQLLIFTINLCAIQEKEHF